MIAVLLSACGLPQSGEVASSDIYAFLEVSGNSADSVSCRAAFRQGSSLGPDLVLTNGDSVKCTDGAVTAPMYEESNFFTSTSEYAGKVGYSLSAVYKVIFTRSSTGEVFTSTAQLPDAMSISYPTDGLTLSRESPILMNWVGAASDGVIGTVTYTLSTGAKSSFNSAKASESQTSGGSLAIQDYTINNADLTSATVRLTRERTGTLDAKWGGRGQMTAKQYAEKSVWFSPAAPASLLREELEKL